MAARGITLGFNASETMAFSCLLIDGVMATNNNCPQECATSTGAHSCGQ